MKSRKGTIWNFSIRVVLNCSFLLCMSLFIPLGHLLENINSDCNSEMKLTDEKDIESEETESEEEKKEEKEKDKLLNQLLFVALSSQQKLHQLHNMNWNWSLSHGEVPTPPPKSCFT